MLQYLEAISPPLTQVSFSDDPTRSSSQRLADVIAREEVLAAAGACAQPAGFLKSELIWLAANTFFRPPRDLRTGFSGWLGQWLPSLQLPANGARRRISPSVRRALDEADECGKCYALSIITS